VILGWPFVALGRSEGGLGVVFGHLGPSKPASAMSWAVWKLFWLDQGASWGRFWFGLRHPLAGLGLGDLGAVLRQSWGGLGPALDGIRWSEACMQPSVLIGTDGRRLSVGLSSVVCEFSFPLAKPDRGLLDYYCCPT